jgi:hypothetical protein
VLGWTLRPGRVEDGWQIEDTFPQPQQQPYGRIAECIDDQGAHFQFLQS